MNKKWIKLFGAFIGLIIIIYPMKAIASTEVGIEFKKSATISSSEVSKEPFTPNKPIIKSSGTLPQTGELLQPTILLLLGFLFVIIIAAIYLSIQNNSKEDYS